LPPLDENERSEKYGLAKRDRLGHRRSVPPSGAPRRHGAGQLRWPRRASRATRGGSGRRSKRGPGFARRLLNGDRGRGVVCSESASSPVAWRLPKLVERPCLVQGLGYRKQKGSQGVHDLAEFLGCGFQAGLPKKTSPLSHLRRVIGKDAGQRDGFR